MAALGLAADTAAATGAEEPRRPWWREALELPEDVVNVFAWPVKKGVLFAERVQLQEWVLDALYFDEARTKGWFPNFSFGGEIQSALGVRVFDNDVRGGGEELSVATLFATNDFEEKRVEFRGHLPAFTGPATWLTIEAAFQEDNDEDFFVRTLPDGSLRFGSATGRDDDTTYELDRFLGRFEAGWRASKRLRLGARFQPIYGDVEAGGGAEPPIPREIDGFGGPVVLLGGESFASWDARDSDVRPRRGWFAGVEGGAWAGTRGETTTGRNYRYARYRVDVRRHQPTFRRDRSVVIRAVLDRMETLDGGAVPFWELPTLDEDHALRAFERNRFQDEGAILFNVEYRYPIWDLWDAYLFVDEGQVFRHYSDVRFEGFEWAGGAGILFFSEKSLLMRVQYAVGDEDQLFRIDLGQAF